MKILLGSYQCESNSFAKVNAFRKDFEILTGQDVLNRSAATKVFRESGFEIVPMLFATALPSGKVEKADYLDILEEFLNIIRQHSDADGIYLYFHGSMLVDGIGSGEEYFVKAVREITDAPISVACDFHATLSDGLLDNIQALSGFRTAPHTDYDETEIRAAKALVRIVKEGLTTKVVRFHLPMLLADAAVTAKEPYASAIQALSRLDAMDNVVACSILNSQAWIDAEYVGVSVTASYFGEGSRVLETAKEIADELWRRRNEFSFGIPALAPDEALALAQTLEKPVFFSDSGDNTTAGAEGKSTFFLQNLNGLSRTLVASIFAEEATMKYFDKPVGTQVSIKLPADEYTNEWTLSGELVGKGTILGFVSEVAGRGIIVRSNGVDVILSNVRTAFISREHFTQMGVRTEDYDYVAVKLGYLWPGIQPLAKSTVFVLTPGTSTNDFTTLRYQNLKQTYFSIGSDIHGVG